MYLKTSIFNTLNILYTSHTGKYAVSNAYLFKQISVQFYNNNEPVTQSKFINSPKYNVASILELFPPVFGRYPVFLWPGFPLLVTLLTDIREVPGRRLEHV